MKPFLVALALLSLAVPASASIAVFSDGRNMKIEAYAVADSTVHLTIAGGGTLSVPLARVERIVDDEIPSAVEQVAAGTDSGVFPRRSWRFIDGSGPLFNSKFDSLIVEAARHHDVDAALVSAVIKAESDYDPKTVSHKGAQGLMQLMPATAKRFGVTNSFDPVENVYGGTKYLRWLLDKFEGNADLAVAAYNAGEGNIAKYAGVPPFRETVNYIHRIARHIRTAIGNEVIPEAAEMDAIAPVATMSALR